MIKYNKKQIYNIAKFILISILLVVFLNIAYKYLFSYKELFFPYSTMTCRDDSTDNNTIYDVKSGYKENNSDCNNNNEFRCLEINRGLNSGLYDESNRISQIRNATCSEIQTLMADFIQEAADNCD